MRWFGALLGLGLVLSACATAGKAIPQEEPVSTLPAATATPESGFPGALPEREIAPAMDALTLAAEQLDVPATDLTLVKAEFVEWPDASLGCPQPEMMYAQVITPGWRFVFTTREGATVTLHTDQDLQTAILCDALAAERAVSTTVSDQVRDLLAEKLKVSPETLTLISAIETEWADASLGCPQPGMMYAQVITPGYQYRFADQSGRQYDVRTGRTPANFVLCELPLLSTPPAAVAPTNMATRRAIEWLAQQQGISADQITLVSTEAVDWPDSCLGCKEPGIYCLTVIVPGYRVLLQVGELQYEVRTDRDGANCAMCKP